MAEKGLFLRMFVEVADISGAAAIGDSAKGKLTRFGQVEPLKVERYWKIPSYFELYISMMLNRTSTASFDEILGMFGDGWASQGVDDKQWAVWNPGPSKRFFAPEVRWANVEFL